MKQDRVILIVFGFFVILLISVSVFSLLSSVFLKKSNNSNLSLPSTSTSNHFSKKNFTDFDRALALKLMDKDGDGKCDACGMDVEVCIDSGQLECNMVPEAKFGLLDSAHIHADFKVYLNNQEFDFAKREYFVKSKFMHVENDVPEEFGKLMHIHATGMPLWLFFESLGMTFNKNCFELDSGKEYCSDSNKSLKFYVNGITSSEFQNYVPKDKDKILITYGNESSEEIQKQLDSITSFA